MKTLKPCALLAATLLVAAGCQTGKPRLPGSLAIRPGGPAAAAGPNATPATSRPGAPATAAPGGSTPGGGATPAPGQPSPLPTGAVGTPLTPSRSGGGGRHTQVSCPTEAYKQVERLARPGVNEGLVLQNALLNTYNAVGPTVDLTADAAPVRTDAVRTLTAFGNSDTTPIPTVNTDPDKALLLGAGSLDLIVTNFLPDVMRIDTKLDSGYTGAGFANVTRAGRLVGGRWLTDDAIDATLLYLVENGTNTAVSGLTGVTDALHTDNVDYATSHAQMPYTTFPYLVNPY